MLKPNPLTAALPDPDPVVPPQATGCVPTAPTSAERRLVGAHFPAPVLRQLRMLVTEEERTIRSLLAEALNELFAKKKLPPIA